MANRRRWGGLAGLVAGLLAALLPASACGTADASPDSLLSKDSIVIGVKPDQPGLGVEKGDGTFEGFDVDVAKYVAGKLGFASDEISFTATPSSEREARLKDGTVQLIFASYSITPVRKTEVNFAGPYYVAHQDTLVRSGDQNIKNVRDLRARRLCAVEGSNSWKRVIEEKLIAAYQVNAKSYSECIQKLLAGEVDAVSTDDLILAGFAAAEGDRVKIINAPFTDERYGVGIAKGDLDGCEAVNKAITEMYQDGTAAKLLKKWFGSTTLKPAEWVPQFEGCF
ncbi:glutamate ABC transporter substrate-binding protein [Flindersiella endophytica]